MRLTGRRESSNVDDRRGVRISGKAGAGMGIGGIILVAIISLIMGGNPLDMLQQMGDMSNVTTTTSPQEFSAEEQELAHFSKQILAGTEDVWSELFKRAGRTYQNPQMVLFTDQVQTGCGGATSQVGPFYCSADQSLYLDLSFFSQMRSQLGADGDFAYAYVIAHEVGHHVEYLLGILSRVHSQMSRMSQTEANKLSVRLELLADFYAGVWAHYDNKMFDSVEDGDLEEAINCASVIGDDYLQKKARGYAQPETFNHGTSEQRMHWFKLGYVSGDMSQGEKLLSVNQ